MMRVKKYMLSLIAISSVLICVPMFRPDLSGADEPSVGKQSLKERIELLEHELVEANTRIKRLEVQLTDSQGKLKQEIGEIPKFRYGIGMIRAKIYHGGGIQPAKTDDVWNVPSNQKGAENHITPPDMPAGARILAAWYEYERGLLVWRHFDHLDVGQTSNQTQIAVYPVSPDRGPPFQVVNGDAGIKIYYLYQY